MSHVIKADHVVLIDTLSLQRLWTRSSDQSLLSHHVTFSMVSFNSKDNYYSYFTLHLLIVSALEVFRIIVL